MENCTKDNYDAMYDYCECALEELMYEYTIDQMEYLDADVVIDFIQFNTDCIELIEYETEEIDYYDADTSYNDYE